MAHYIPLQDKLDEIEEQGKRLRRRLDYLKGERDFLVDMLLTRPTRDMEAQRRLLQEWDEEIDKLEQSIAYLRREYVKYKNQLISYEIVPEALSAAMANQVYLLRAKNEQEIKRMIRYVLEKDKE